MSKKRMKWICGMWAILFIVVGLNVKTFAASDFQMKTSDDGKTVVLIKYTGKESKVSVPDGVNLIGSRAFAKNTKVKEVILSDSVTDIGEAAFEGCTNLKKVHVSKKLTRIWSQAFAKCKKLEQYTINKKLTRLDEYAFYGCTGLKNIKVQKGNKKFKIYKGALCSKNMKKLYIYPALRKSGKKYVIPKSVKYIDAGAFLNNRYLTTIRIKGKVTNNDDTFSNCKSLKKVVFENAYRGTVSFSNCKKLKEVQLAEGTIRIGEYQFAGCKNLKKINIPSSLKEIGEHAFSGAAIKKVVIPKSVKKMGLWAFSGCTKLKTVTMPGNITVTTSITEQDTNATFFPHVNTIKFSTDLDIQQVGSYYADNLVVSSSDKKYKSVNGVIYSKDGTKTVRVPDRSRVVIADGCTEFAMDSIIYPERLADDNYMYHCENLKELVLPESVKEISWGSFTKEEIEDRWSLLGNYHFEKITINNTSMSEESIKKFTDTFKKLEVIAPTESKPFIQLVPTTATGAGA